MLIDEHQDEFRARFPRFNPTRAAVETQQKWVAFLHGQSPESRP